VRSEPHPSKLNFALCSTFVSPRETVRYRRQSPHARCRLSYACTYKHIGARGVRCATSIAIYQSHIGCAALKANVAPPLTTLAVPLSRLRLTVTLHVLEMRNKQLSCARHLERSL
jgi:hypothetical protein